MFKKVCLIILKIIGLFSFVVFLLTTGYLKNYVINSTALYYLIILVSPILLIPFLKEWNKPKKILKHFIIISTVILSLEGATNVLDNYRGFSRFSYHLGNTAGPIGIIIHQRPIQTLLFKILNVFPISTQYIFLTAEDAARALEIKNLFDDSKPSFCKHYSKYECFEKIFHETQLKAPFNTTGLILMTAVGAKILLDVEKKSTATKYTNLIHIINLSKSISNDIQTSSRINNILPHFPIHEINELSKEEKAILDKELKKEDFGFTDIILKKSSYEAYLLLETENELIKKFKKDIVKKIQSLKESGLKSLKTEKTKKNLSKEEIADFTAQFNSI